MANEQWPTSAEVHAAVAERLSQLLSGVGGSVERYARRTLSSSNGVLSDTPHSARTVLVPGSYIGAGGPDWHVALWPTVGSECLMAAADLFDDAADADTDDHPGVILTAAAGLLSLAGDAVTRVVEDGADPDTAIALAHQVGTEFARAANGQALNLQAAKERDALKAFQESAAKSGPLGELMARLGARTATSDAHMVDLLGEFGRRLGVRSQLMNDLRDAAPAPEHLKADVRAGAHTVPLAFAGSSGAPQGLSDQALTDWERTERARVAAAGGLTVTFALAEAERLRLEALLDKLAAMGHPTRGLRELLS